MSSSHEHPLRRGSAATSMVYRPQHQHHQAMVEDADDEEDDDERGEGRLSFWTPRVASDDDVISTQPWPFMQPDYPEWEDLDVPSSYEKKTVRNKRTKNVTVVQTGVFYFFSCSSCRGARGQQQVREMARSANEKFKHMWKAEIENEPVKMNRKGKIIEVDGTRPSDIAVVMQPSTMISGGVQIPEESRPHAHHVIIKGMEEILEDLKPLRKGKGLKWRVRHVDDQVLPVFEDTSKNFDVGGNDKRPMEWAMLPPPPPVMKKSSMEYGRPGPRSRLAEYDDESETMFMGSSKGSPSSRANRSSVTLQRGRGNTNSTMTTITATGLPVIDGQHIDGAEDRYEPIIIDDLPVLPPPVMLSSSGEEDFFMNPAVLQELLNGKASPALSQLHSGHKSLAFPQENFKTPQWRRSVQSFDNRKYMMDNIGPRDQSHSPFSGSFEEIPDLNKKLADRKMNPRSPVDSVMSFSSDIKALIRANTDFDEKHGMRSPRMSEIALASPRIEEVAEIH